MKEFLLKILEQLTVEEIEEVLLMKKESIKLKKSPGQ